MKLLFYALGFAVFFIGCSTDNQTQVGFDALAIDDFSRSKKIFNLILDEDPKNSRARYGLAVSWYKEGQAFQKLQKANSTHWEKAEHNFSILAKTDTTVNVSSWHSMCLYYLAKNSLTNNPSGSLKLLNQSIKLDSENTFALQLKALISFELEQYSTAIELWNRLTIINETDTQAWISLGKTYWKIGEYNDALIHWELGLEQNPNNQTLNSWVDFAQENLGLK